MVPRLTSKLTPSTALHDAAAAGEMLRQTLDLEKGVARRS